jgi:hypothetical protein
MNKHLIEATKLALEALYMANTREWPENKIGAAINALSAAIEQAEKPVAWVGLTEKDFSAINQSCLTKLQAATSAESILKEKNT